MSKEYPCKLSESGMCKYGGSKYYNYGFVCGSASYCYKVHRWISGLKECPERIKNND